MVRFLACYHTIIVHVVLMSRSIPHSKPAIRFQEF